MKLTYNKIFLEHETGNNPENKDRLRFFKNLPDTKIENGEQYLRLVHSPPYVNFIKRCCEQGQSIDGDTILSKKSFEVACYAVGAAIQAAKENGFALVRPPGHHASKNKGAGFCVFNNIAIATKYLLEHGKKVFILDFDLHHGNGTQDIFLGEENVMYLSLHQSPQYPGTGLKSEKNCINIPLKFGTGDEEYISHLEEKLVPALEKFKPDVVAVSAGFDGYHKDLGYLGKDVGFKLTTKSYEKIKEILSSYKTFYVLEGGYNPESIKEGVEIFIT